MEDDKLKIHINEIIIKIRERNYIKQIEQIKKDRKIFYREFNCQKCTSCTSVGVPALLCSINLSCSILSLPLLVLLFELNEPLDCDAPAIDDDEGDDEGDFDGGDVVFEVDIVIVIICSI